MRVRIGVIEMGRKSECWVGMAILGTGVMLASFHFCHTTLWNNNSRKQAINDILQGSAGTYFRCGGVVNNQIKKEGLSFSLSVKKNKIGEYLAK